MDKSSIVLDFLVHKLKKLWYEAEIVDFIYHHGAHPAFSNRQQLLSAILFTLIRGPLGQMRTMRSLLKRANSQVDGQALSYSNLSTGHDLRITKAEFT